MTQVFSVAKEFVKLSISGEEKDPLTNLRLQKMLYYAQAWSLIIRQRELFADEIQAWRHGPVVPEVYFKLPNDQSANLIIADTFAAVPDLEAADAEFVRSVWQAYNPYSALMLSHMSQEELPWQKAWGAPGSKDGTAPISLDDIETFFARQAMPAALAAYSHELRQREQEAELRLAEMPPIDASRLMAAAKSITPAARRLLASEG